MKQNVRQVASVHGDAFLEAFTEISHNFLPTFPLVLIKFHFKLRLVNRVGFVTC